MGKPRAFTDEEEQAIRAEYDAGATLPALAERYRSSPATITHAVHRAGGKTRPRGSYGVKHGRKPWKWDSNRDEKVAASYAAGATLNELAQHYNVSPGTIASAVRRAGGAIRPAAHLCGPNEETKQLVRALYATGKTMREVGAATGRDVCAVWHILHAVGEYRPCRKLALREDFFDVIDTEEKAYWLGFLGADGNVMCAGQGGLNCVRLRLAVCDLGHVEKFRQALGSEAEIRTYPNWKQDPTCPVQDTADLTVNSRHMAESLTRHGVTPNKSFTFTPPAFTDHNLAAAFWRGMVDGDGSLGVYTTRRTPVFSLSLAGSYNATEGFMRFVEHRCRTQRSATGRKPCRHGNIFTAHYGGREYVRQIVTLLYGNTSVSLNRKQERADEIMRLAAIPQKRDRLTLTDEELLALKDHCGTYRATADAVGMTMAGLRLVFKRRGIFKRCRGPVNCPFQEGQK